MDHLLEEVALGVSLPTRRDLDQPAVDQVAAAFQVHERASRAEPRPGRDVRTEQVESKPGVDRDALALGPVEVGIDEAAPRRGPPIRQPSGSGRS